MRGTQEAPAGRRGPGSEAPPRTPFPAHLSAPAAVSLTARLGSSNSGPRRRTASRRARPGSAGRCCTSRASPAQAHSRTSALGCWSCGKEQVSKREQSARAGARRQGRVALLGGSARGLPPTPPHAARRALASLFLAAPPLARRPPLAQSRSPPPPRPDSRP